jgi:transcriptional regulator with XRE-family HTH domain
VPTNEVTAPFSKRLKQARERAGLTQHQLGVLANLDEEHAGAKMNQYEKGVHIPKFPRLKDLATALNVPPAYFYADDDELAELLYSYGRLTKAKRRALLKAVGV